MRLIFSSMVLITSTLVLRNDAAQPETDVQMLMTSMSKIMAEMSDIKTELRTLSERKDNTEQQLTQLQELDHGNEYGNFKMDSQLNDTNLEERVQALEFQMENVHDDITSLNTGLSDLNEDVEGQFVLVEEQITLIFDEIFQLIDETDTLDSSIEVIEDTIDRLTATDSEIMDFIDELDSRVTTLELLNGTDEDVINILNEHEAEINSLNITTEYLRVDVTNVEGTIVTLQQSDEEQEVELSTLDERVTVLESLNGTNGDVEDALNDLDERVFELELDGTFAFHAVLASYSSIPEDTPAIFDEVNVNLGNGYSPTTGLFTVPSGGAGCTISTPIYCTTQMRTATFRSDTMVLTSAIRMQMVAVGTGT